MFTFNLAKTSLSIIRAAWCPCSAVRSRPFHGTGQCWRPIEEFFDDKDNWGKEEVRTGRPWRVEELRLKSQADLHKLWYVLLKEKNMLLTMRAEAERQTELFPNPERIDKVEESMGNVESVIHERNQAYLTLEHGVTGQPPQHMVTTLPGFNAKREVQEHLEPAHMNPGGKEYETPWLDEDQYAFQKVWKERMWWKEVDKRDDEKRKTNRHRYIHKW